MPVDFGFHFQNCKHFMEYFRFYLLNTVIRKNDTGNFCLFGYFQSYNDKGKFSFLQEEQSRSYKGAIRLSCEKPFLPKLLASFFSSNISIYIEKNPVGKLCKVFEMELKIYIQAHFSRPKTRFRKNQI